MWSLSSENKLIMYCAVVPSYIAESDVVGFGLQGKWSVEGKRVTSGHKTLVCFFVEVLDRKTWKL